MKKVILGTLLATAITMTAGCGDKEEPTKEKDIKAAAEQTKGKNEKKEKESVETVNAKTPRLEVIETIDVFGGGTFDLNKDIDDDAGDIYITEEKDKVYMTIRDNNYGTFRAISGNKDKWQSIGEASFDDNQNQYPRGFYFFKEENDEIISNMFDYEDMNYTFGPSENIPSGDSLRLVNTSKGEGVIVGNDDSYKLYIDSELILEFNDVKEVMDMVPYQTQEVTEAGVYVDIELKKMYFLDDDRNDLYQLDLETGEPLFDDGIMKTVELAASYVKIIGDSNGNLFVVQSDKEKVTATIYDKNLEALTDEIAVPVKNPDGGIAVTLTPVELHIWNVHSYELEPALQLVKLTKESVSNVNVSTENTEGNEGTGTNGKDIVMNFLEASRENDDETVNNLLVSEFGEDYKEIAIGGFRNVPEFEIIEVSKAEEPDRTYLPATIAESSDVETYNALINVKEGPQAGRGTLIVTLYKEKDGWKVVSLNSK